MLRLGGTQLVFELGDDEVTIEMYEGARFGVLVGRSPVTRAVMAQLALAAKSDATVLRPSPRIRRITQTATGCYAAAVGDEYSPAQRAMLEAQIAHARSDDRIREEVAIWRDARTSMPS
jgi:hypothetical protein